MFKHAAEAYESYEREQKTLYEFFEELFRPIVRPVLSLGKYLKSLW